MEKSSSVIVLASTLCFFSLVGLACCGGAAAPGPATEALSVEGLVYCDNCRTQFMTRISDPLKGAKVRLECRDREGGSVSLSTEAETDEQGRYHIAVDGDHEEEVCEVILVKSPQEDCSEISTDSHAKLSARVSLTNNNGIAGPYRIPNPLGFLKKETDPECAEVLKELGLTLDGDIV